MHCPPLTSAAQVDEPVLTTTKSLFGHRFWGLAPVIDPSHRLNASHALSKWSLVIQACDAWPKVLWRARGSMKFSV